VPTPPKSHNAAVTHLDQERVKHAGVPLLENLPIGSGSAERLRVHVCIRACVRMSGHSAVPSSGGSVRLQYLVHLDVAQACDGLEQVVRLAYQLHVTVPAQATPRLQLLGTQVPRPRVSVPCTYERCASPTNGRGRASNSGADEDAALCWDTAAPECCAIRNAMSDTCRGRHVCGGGKIAEGFRAGDVLDAVVHHFDEVARAVGADPLAARRAILYLGADCLRQPRRGHACRR
jgi:hypothetical protein